MKPDPVLEDRIQLEALVNEGLSASTIATRLKKTERWVFKWKKRIRDKENQPGPWFLDAARSGRPPVGAPIKKAVVKAVEGKKYKSLRKTAKRLCAKGMKVSFKSIGNILKKEGLKPFKVREAPALSEAQKKKRLQFARKNKDRDWKSVLFTDEKDFPLFHPPNKQNVRVWAHDKGDVPITPQMKHPPTLKVWAGVSGIGKLPLVFYKDDYCTGKGGGMTGADYRRMLEDEVLPAATELFGDNGGWTLLQDGASPHTAKVAMSLLASRGIDVISGGPKGEFPSDSPDLNYIENIFGYMQDKFDEVEPKTVQAAHKTLLKIWAELPQELIDNCVASMPDRLAELVSAKGETIRV